MRKELVDKKEKVDFCFIYIVLVYIIKFRGYFLIEDDSFDVRNIDILK